MLHADDKVEDIGEDDEDEDGGVGSEEAKFEIPESGGMGDVQVLDE